jgi:hypothetical protein
MKAPRMTIEQQIKANPPNWKDWLTGLSMALTLGAVTLQGGRILERLDATNTKLAALGQQMTNLQSEQNRLATDAEKSRGVDRLHDEQINTLRRDLDAATRRPVR